MVFNAHYLTWFDEAVTGFFDHLGTSYPDLMSVRSRYAVGAHRDRLCGTGSVARHRAGRGRVRKGRDDEFHDRLLGPSAGETTQTRSLAVRGRNIYVVVSTDDWTKRPVPDALRSALAR